MRWEDSLITSPTLGDFKQPEELLEDEKLMSFFKSSKKKPLNRGRICDDVDESRCMCRVWVGVDKEDLDGTGYPAGKVGYGLQCKSKKKVGNFVDVVPKV